MSNSVTRREFVVAAGTAAIALPVLQGMPGCEAQPEAGRASARPDQWIATVAPQELPAGAFRAYKAQRFMLARAGKVIVALDITCTHRACDVDIAAQRKQELECPCHGARFDLRGQVLQGPATEPLARYALRRNAAGVVEVNVGRKLAATDPAAELTVE